jgi:hypothetical protein
MCDMRMENYRHNDTIKDNIVRKCFNIYYSDESVPTGLPIDQMLKMASVDPAECCAQWRFMACLTGCACSICTQEESVEFNIFMLQQIRYLEQSFCQDTPLGDSKCYSWMFKLICKSITLSFAPCKIHSGCIQVIYHATFLSITSFHM